MSSLILKVSNSNSGGSGGGPGGTTNEGNCSANNDSVVVSAAVDVIPTTIDNKVTTASEVTHSFMSSTGEATKLVSTTATANAIPTVSTPNSDEPSTVTSSSIAMSRVLAQTKAAIPPLPSPIQTTTPSSATVVVTSTAGNGSSLIARPPTGTLGASSVAPNSAATTVITAVPPVSVKPLPATVPQHLAPKLPQQPSPKISKHLSIVATNQQAPLTTANPLTPLTTTVIGGSLRNNLQPPISFSTGARPHQLTIPHVNLSKQSPSPTITLSPVKPQGPSGATLVTAIQSSQAQQQPHTSGTVLVSNNVTPTGAGATIVATHRQLHTVTQQPHRQLQQTVVQQQQQNSIVTRVAPTLIAGHTSGTHQHVVQHHPPPLRMVHLPAGASVTGGNSNLTTRIAVPVSSGSMSAHVPPTTVSLPQSPAPIAIRHALPQAPLARTSPVSNPTGVSPQLPRSPIRHPHPQLPQTPVNSGGNPSTTLLTSRSPHSAPPAHLSSTSIITHHPQQSANAVVNRTIPLASVLASANQPRQIQQQLVTQRVVSTGPGGTTNTVVQGLQQQHHPALGIHSLNQTPTGAIMVSHHRPGTISMLPQAPTSGTVTAGGLLVQHPPNSGNGNIMGGTSSNPSQGQHTVSAGSGSHHLVSFPSHPGPPQTSQHQRITLPTNNMFAHLSGAHHRGGGGALTVSAAVNPSSGGSISGTPSVASTVAGRHPIATGLAKSSTTILPPNALHHLLASHPHPQQQQEDDLDVTDADASPGHHLPSQHQSINHPQIIGVSRGGTLGVTLNTGRTTVTLPSPRQQQQVQQPRDRRSLPCQLALQDHNYYSRPPPTPPPPPQSPPILRDVLQEHQRRQQLHQSFNASSPFNSVLAAAEVHHQQQQQQQFSPATKQGFVVGGPSTTTNRSAFSPTVQPHLQSNHRSPVNVISQHASLSPHTQSKVSPNATNLGSIVRLPQYTPDSQKFAAAIVAAVSSPPIPSKKHQTLLSPSGISINGPAHSNATASMGKSCLPSRVEAHFRSIQEAGVGPMAPLVDDAPSDSGSASPNINDMNRADKELHDRDDGEETETAPEADGEDDSITRCICDFLHDDGYMICCDKCYVWQHVVCMGLDKNNIPDEYLCEVCKPRPIDRKRAKAMQARRRSELYHHSSSSDEGGGSNRQFSNRTKSKGQQKNDKKISTKGGLTGSKKILDRKADRINSKDHINRKGINSKISKKSAAQALAMLNSGTNQLETTFGSSTMIPQQLLPTNLLENRLTILEDSDGNIVSPMSPMAGNKLKKQYKKRKCSEKDLKKSNSNVTPATAKGRRKLQQLKRQQQNKGRQRSIDSDGDDGDATTDEEEEEDDNTNMEVVTLDASQQLRSWIDQYEEAVTNHYSPELRARLAGAGKWGGGISNGDLRPSVIGSMTRCNVSLQGNGVKILTASNSLSSNTPVIECRGKLMLATQYRAANKKSPGSGQNDNSLLPVNPYVFFYQLSDSLEICLDGKTYGNDSRFCRRSTNDYNAELRHVIDKGSLHLFIITLNNVEKNQEILLPPDSSCRLHESSPLPSINADLREITMKTSKPSLASLTANGVLSPTMSPVSVRSSDLDESTPLSSTRNKQSDDNSSPSPQTKQDRRNQKEKRKFPKLVLKSPKKSKALAAKENKVANNARKVKNGNEAEKDAKKQNTTKPNEDKAHKRSTIDKGGETGEDSTPTSPTKYGSTKPSPGKLGLPDNSGLIVGVNTINYDASSELKNKAKSREERKMEMIMKAFEAMERAEQKKKETQGSADNQDRASSGGGGYQSVRGSTDSDKSSATNKRRRSSAKGNTDSNLDASSAEDMANDDTDDGEDDEEGTPGARKKTDKGKTKKGSGKTNRNRKSTAPNTPKRRRSRISSGGSGGSGTEDLSNTKENNHDSSTASTGGNTAGGNAQNGPFRFPKTKKTLMSDWLQESNEASRSPNPTFGDDDDVSANYLRGSRSPPGIAMHLLRSSIGNNTTTTPLSPNISSPHSPVKTVGNQGCSAKKRWLRQAISEDHGPGDVLSPVHEVAFLMNGSNSPVSSGETAGGNGGSTFNDYVTPLKKRRLQNYKDEQRFLEDEANASSEENNVPSLHSVPTPDFTAKTPISYSSSYTEDVKVLPNGIKKKLLHNLVLEAVLDRAMEDMLNVRPKDESLNDDNTEIDVATTSSEDIEVKGEEINQDEVESAYKHTKTGKLETMAKEEDEEAIHEDQNNSFVEDKEMSFRRAEDLPAQAQYSLAENKYNVSEILPNDSKVYTDKFKAETIVQDRKPLSTTVTATFAPSTTSNIPEPSSVFKSFFKSNVSLEALEAELEETRRQREAEQKQLQQLAAKQREEVERPRQVGVSQLLEMKQEEKSCLVEKYENETAKLKQEGSPLAIPPQLSTKAEMRNHADLVKMEEPPIKSEINNYATTTSGEDSKSQIREIADADTLKLIDTVTDAIHQTSDLKSNDLSNVSGIYSNKLLQDDKNQVLAAFSGEKDNILASNLSINTEISTSRTAVASAEPPKPKEKRKFSLADYKRRRQQQQQQQLSNVSTSSDQTTRNIGATSAAPIIGIPNNPAITKHMPSSAIPCSSENSLDSCSSITSNGCLKPKDVDVGKVIEGTLNSTVSTHPMSHTESLIDQSGSIAGGNNDQINDDFGAGTPTMDEDQMAPATTVLPSSGGITDISLPSANAPITLNTLPLFEKLEKLEKAQKENKKKAMGSLSPPPEPKREDLTERLKKEFGLTVDADEDDETPISEGDDKGISSNNLNINENRDEGDATPEEDSPPPPPVGAGSSLSSIHRHPTMTRLPDQMAQYPTTATGSSSFNSVLPQSNVDNNVVQQPGYPKGQYNNSNNYGPTTQSVGGQSRHSDPSSVVHQAQQPRATSYQQHSSGSYSQTSSYQRHPQPASRSHPPVNHPGHRMAYPPPLPPASVIANAPHPNKISDRGDTHSSKPSINVKRSSSSKEKEYYGQHSWSSDRDRDRDQRVGSANSRSYYASTTSRGISDRSSMGSRSSLGGGSYSGEKSSSSREYNRREYSQIRTASSTERLGSHGGSGASLGTDRDLRGGGSEHGSSGTSRSSSSANVSLSSRSSSKSSYSRSSYYNN